MIAFNSFSFTFLIPDSRFPISHFRRCIGGLNNYILCSSSTVSSIIEGLFVGSHVLSVSVNIDTCTNKSVNEYALGKTRKAITREDIVASCAWVNAYKGTNKKQMACLRNLVTEYSLLRLS